MGHAGLHLHPEGPEVIGHKLGRFELPVPQLGILVNLMAKFKNSGGMLFHRFLNSSVIRTPTGCEQYRKRE
jgi:hypothetical protein